MAPEDVDRAMRFGTNWPIGPCALIDLIGVDVHVHASEALYDALREPRMAPPARLVRMAQAGHLGRKTRPRLLRLRLSFESRAQTFSTSCATAGSSSEAAKSSVPGGEDLGAARRLVLRHLGGASRSHQVGDPRQHLRPGRRGGRPRVDLDPVARPSGRPSARPVPANAHGAAAAPVTRYGSWCSPWFEATYWTPTSEDSGRPRSRHSRDADEPRAGAAHLPEEVVRGQEHQVPAQVAVAPQHVVRVLGRVLLVAGEDDEVVRPRERVAAPERLQVVVGEHVGALAGPVQPRHEGQVPVLEPERDAEVEVRPREVDAADRAGDVPAVAPAVAVLVVEVVRLPGVRREDDRDAAAEPRGADDQRRVADAAVRCRGRRGGSRARSATARPGRRGRCAARCGARASRAARGGVIATPLVLRSRSVGWSRFAYAKTWSLTAFASVESVTDGVCPGA